MEGEPVLPVEPGAASLGVDEKIGLEQVRRLGVGSSQRMMRDRDGIDPLVVEQRSLQARPLPLAERDPQVGVVDPHEPVGVACADPQLHVWMEQTEVAEPRHQPVRRQRRGHRQLDLVRAPLAPEPSDGTVDGVEPATHALGKAPPGLGQDDPAAVPVEDRRAERGLQLLDGVTDRGLTEPQVVAGTSEGTRVDNREEDPQVPVRHADARPGVIDHVDDSMQQTTN